MELHHRVALIDTLLEEAEQKRTALTHALRGCPETFAPRRHEIKRPPGGNET
jgi:hypothetical protein